MEHSTKRMRIEKIEEEKLPQLKNHSHFSQPVFEWTRTVLFAVIVMIIVLTFFFRLVCISGPSMENTLKDGERVILTNFMYTPKDGDIVAIAHGGKLGITIIKRVIATQGEKLSIDYNKNEVTVDGVIINEPYVNGTTTNAANWKVPYVIPKGYCFVMGDNRNVSKDSRSDQVGLIPLSDIIGKAQFVIFPINHFGPINNNTGESNYSGNTASTY